jgi:hypothetical protein
MNAMDEVADRPAVRPYVPSGAKRAQMIVSSQMEDVLRSSFETASTRLDYNREIGMLVQQESIYECQCAARIIATESDSDGENCSIASDEFE